jgi:hypothetical protein
MLIANLPNKLSVYSAPSTSWNISPFGTIPWSRLVIGTSRTVGSAKKFVRITSGFARGGEFTKTLRKV